MDNDSTADREKGNDHSQCCNKAVTMYQDNQGRYLHVCHGCGKYCRLQK